MSAETQKAPVQQWPRIIGAGMAFGLYDAAFAALVREYGVDARLPITGITLLGGFASTVGWPLTAWLIVQWDWRAACFFWATANILVALPLYLRCFPKTPDRRWSAQGEGGDVSSQTDAATEAVPATGWDNKRFWLLAFFGAATAFVTSAMAAHLPGIIVATGLSAATAIAASTLVGPAQVAARLGEFIAARKARTDPLTTARVATALHPLGGGVLFALAAWPGGAFVFALCHGAGNGMITIAKGALPLHLFGPCGYGLLQGRLAVAQRGMQAAAPFAMALLIDTGGAPLALSVSAAMSVLALLALMVIRRPGCVERR